LYASQFLVFVFLAAEHVSSLRGLKYPYPFLDMVPTSPSTSEGDGSPAEGDRQPTSSDTRVPTPAPFASGLSSAGSSRIRGGRDDHAPLSGALPDAASRSEIASSGNSIPARTSRSPLGLGVDSTGDFDTLEDLVQRGALPASFSSVPAPAFSALSPVQEQTDRPAAMASLGNASVDSRAETLSRDLLVDPAGDGSSQHSSLAGDVSSEPLLPAVPPDAPATPALSVPIAVQPAADPLYASVLSALASLTARLEETSVATASAVLEMQERLVVFGGVTRSRFDVLAADLHEMKPIVRAQAGSFLRFGR
jgi:hypothetical protein